MKPVKSVHIIEAINSISMIFIFCDGSHEVFEKIPLEKWSYILEKMEEMKFDYDGKVEFTYSIEKEVSREAFH